MLLRKTINLTDVQLEIEDERGVFSGYASKWGGVDSYGDTIMPGAFAASLSKAMPKMFWNHEWDMPIGKWTVAKEDNIGLFVKGELTPELGQAEDVYSALKHGTIDGLSIGGFLKAGDYTETEAGRTIQKWSSLMEISPVVFPADAGAKIDMASVKNSGPDLIAEIDEIKTIREFEYFLRDSGGLSKRASTALVARVKSLLEQGEPDQLAEAIVMRELLQRATSCSSLIA